MVTHVLAGEPVPNGLILSSIVGIGAAMAGIKVGTFTEQKKADSERHKL
jgi:multisubunit Na+/H+ antiporter MnhC subunit